MKVTAAGSGAEFPHQDGTRRGPVHAPLPEAAFDPDRARVFGEARQALAHRQGLPPEPQTSDGSR
jgi:hypothetical protein